MGLIGRRVVVPLCSILVLGVRVLAQDADPGGAEVPNRTEHRYVRSQLDDFEQRTESLSEVMEGVPGVVREDDRVWVCDRDGTRYEAITIFKRSLIFATDVGLIGVEFESYFELAPLEVSGWLATLETNGFEDQYSAEENRLEFVVEGMPLVGHVVKTQGMLVDAVSGLVYRNVGEHEDQSEALQQTLLGAARELADELDARSFLRRALLPVLEVLVESDRRLPGFEGLGELEDGDSGLRIASSSLRRWLRHGWLSNELSGYGAAPAFLAALQVFDQPNIEATYQLEDVQILVVRQPDGRKAFARIGPDSSSLAYRPSYPRLIYGDDSDLTSLFVECVLPPDVDPLSPGATAEAIEIRLHWDGMLIGTVVGGRLRTDRGQWRRELSITDEADHPFPMENLLPPHILVSDAFGDHVALVTERGRIELRTMKSDPERFLEQAATALDTPQRLDLIGQLLWRYCFDAEEVGVGAIPGTVYRHGDWQSSAEETVRLSFGGELRGDCDDYSELLSSILDRAGESTFQMGTLGHVSELWIEPGLFRGTVHRFHTGPSMTVKGRTVADALSKLHRLEAPMQAFDPWNLRVLRRDNRTGRCVPETIPLQFATLRAAREALRPLEEFMRRGCRASALATIDALPEVWLVEPSVQFRRGLTLLSLGRYEEALRTFDEVLEQAEWPATRARIEIARVAALLQLGRLRGGTELRQALDRVSVCIEEVEAERQPAVAGFVAAGLVQSLAARREPILVEWLLSRHLEAFQSLLLELKRRERIDEDGDLEPGPYQGVRSDWLQLMAWEFVKKAAFLALPIHHDSEDLLARVDLALQRLVTEVPVSRRAGVYEQFRLLGLVGFDSSKSHDELRSDVRRYLESDESLVSGFIATVEPGKAVSWRSELHSYIEASPTYWAGFLELQLEAGQIDREGLPGLLAAIERSSDLGIQAGWLGASKRFSLHASRVAVGMVLGQEDMVEAAMVDLLDPDFPVEHHQIALVIARAGRQVEPSAVAHVFNVWRRESPATLGVALQALFTYEAENAVRAALPLLEDASTDWPELATEVEAARERLR
ncbi:MAG: hypothetical protein AAF196_16555 [Planctomycetota bacterium]